MIPTFHRQKVNRQRLSARSNVKCEATSHDPTSIFTAINSRFQVTFLKTKTKLDTEYKKHKQQFTAMAGEDIENRRGEKNYYSSTSSADAFEERESQWVSWLIPVFVVANVAMFLVVMYANNCPRDLKNRVSSFRGHNDKCVARFLGRFSFQPLRENPLFGPSSATLEKLGALNWNKVVHGHQGWRLVSCIWLHAGIIHLLANMMSLVFIGVRLEQQFGFVRVGVIYLLSGFGGSILSSVFIQNQISVGASGALFGLLGAMLSELITNWCIYTNKIVALSTLLFIVLINLAVGILPHVDNFAHIGGFLAGFLLGFVLLPRPQFGWIERHNLPIGVPAKSRYKGYQYVLWLVSMILLIVGFTVGLLMLFRGVNGHERCSWCHFVSCVPTSKWECNEA